MAPTYADFVRDFLALLERAEALPRGGAAAAPAPAAPGAPLALILAPHPDDECIVGALPLRLRRESGWRVAAVAVTLGSRTDRRAVRREEMNRACALLGWETPACEDGDLAGLLRRERPRLILFPHDADANATHRRVHGLALAALRALGPDFRAAVAETEYWSTLLDPNLLVGLSAQDAGDLVAALSCHEGEVARNPYHVLLPCWLADGARRGAELVVGQGAAASKIRLASLYRLSLWNGRALERAAPPGRVAPPGADLPSLGGL